MGNYKFHKVYLSRLKFVFLVTYIGITPFLQTPSWCIDKLTEDANFSRGSIVLDCQDKGVPFSGNLTLSPVFIAFMDFTCLAFFLYFRWFKTQWGFVLTKHRTQNTILLIAVACIFIDNVIAMILFKRPFYSDLLRPLIFGCFLHLVRINIRYFYADLRDSATILICIFLFVCSYATVGHFMFRYTYEGFNYFDSISAANYNMLILITTANFPDVMLPAYNDSYWIMLFFVSYLLIGLYFLMSFLLANVFIRFKNRLEEQAVTILCKTETLLREMFKQYDYQSKGYLNWMESKEFFSVLLDLNLGRKRHYEALLELLKEMDYDDLTELWVEHVVDFFLRQDGFKRFEMI